MPGLKFIKQVGAVRDLTFRQRIWLLLGLLIVVVFVVVAVGPIPQDPNYHLFADARTFFGIPNFNDVVSNLGFALVGAFGTLALAGGMRAAIFERSADARPYLIFFVGIALVSVGSVYYHWAPSNERLFWDRLPMSIGFMAISAAVAAPSSPIAGTGPIPKIKIGSRMTFKRAPAIMSLPGSTVSPVARILLVPTMPTTRKGTPLYRMVMKLRIIGIMSAGAPNNLNSGLIVKIPIADITAVIMNDSNRLSVAKRRARR